VNRGHRVTYFSLNDGGGTTALTRAYSYAFDLIELNDDDLRRDPLEVRKATLRGMLPKLALACASTSIWKATARPFSPMPARWDSKASCQSARTRLIAQGARIALTGFRKFDDRPGDHFVAEVGSAFNGRSGGFECDAHETGGLRIEGLAV